ncbi:MAG: zf-HC2 domain-containing protein [Nocardioidaceae bacterium]
MILPDERCREVETSLGVYVLGALSPADHAVVAEHVAQCPHCAGMVAELAPLPGMLAKVDSSVAATGLPTPSPALLQRLVDVADEHDRMRRRRRVAVLAVAAAVLTVAGSVVGWRTLADNPAATPQATVISGTNSATGVSAQIRIDDLGTGTDLSMTLSGVRPGEHCRLVAIDAQGHRQVAATWWADYAGRAQITGSTSIPRAQLASFVVVAGKSDRLVRIPVA